MTKKHALVFSSQRNTLSADIVKVEVDISSGLHSFNLIGLPDKAVDEAKDRVSSAIKHSNFKSPKSLNQKIVVSLAPGELKKSGALFDTPIALAYLLASGEIKFDTDKKMFLGELSLTGNSQKAQGIIPIISSAIEFGFEEVYVPEQNKEEVTILSGIKIITFSNLKELIDHLEKKIVLPPVEHKYSPKHTENKNTISLDAIKGQESVKRALVIAAAGGHNIALYGPPGTGKTLLAKSLVTILPELTKKECLEVTAIHSIVNPNLTSPVYTPPFRQPHHSSSYPSIVGGGNPVRPGEITLANRGVLFLDEFPEFDKRVIESLREPLEEKVITITRANNVASFPASCILCLAFNPCPCGKAGTDQICTCSEMSKSQYKRKLTGPIADRIDIWVGVEAVPFERLKEKGELEKTIKAKELIKKARERQIKRFTNLKEQFNITLNSEINAENIDKCLKVDNNIFQLLETYAKKINLSPRGFHKTLKCARTIADLEGSESINENHILEAINYRTPPEI